MISGFTLTTSTWKQEAFDQENRKIHRVFMRRNFQDLNQDYWIKIRKAWDKVAEKKILTVWNWFRINVIASSHILTSSPLRKSIQRLFRSQISKVAHRHIKKWRRYHIFCSRHRKLMISSTATTHSQSRVLMPVNKRIYSVENEFEVSFSSC